jgi:hypothetical protein
MVFHAAGLNLNQTALGSGQLAFATLVASLVTGVGGTLIARGTRRLGGASDGPAILLRLILSAALTVVLSVVVAAHITARAVVATEKRLHSLLHLGVAQLGHVPNPWQIANAVTPKVDRESTATDVEHSRAPRNGDEAAITRDHRVFEATAVGDHEVADGPKIGAALQQDVRTKDDTSLQEATLIASGVGRDGPIRT